MDMNTWTWTWAWAWGLDLDDIRRHVEDRADGVLQVVAAAAHLDGHAHADRTDRHVRACHVDGEQLHGHTIIIWSWAIDMDMGSRHAPAM